MTTKLSFNQIDGAVVYITDEGGGNQSVEVIVDWLTYKVLHDGAA